MGITYDNSLKTLKDEIVGCYRTFKSKSPEEAKKAASKIVAVTTSFNVIEQFDKEYKNYLWILYQFYAERILLLSTLNRKGRGS